MYTCNSCSLLNPPTPHTDDNTVASSTPHTSLTPPPPHTDDKKVPTLCSWSLTCCTINWTATSF